MLNHDTSVDLKRRLLILVTSFALIICLISSYLIIDKASDRIKSQFRVTSEIIEQIMNYEAKMPRPDFTRELFGVELSHMDNLGRLLNICLDVFDMSYHPLQHHCFSEASGGPAWLAKVLDMFLGEKLEHVGSIGTYPNIKVGEFVLRPNLDVETADIWEEIKTVLMITLGILILNLLIYLPVKRALRPTEEILSVLDQMQKGDLSVRMPIPALVELKRIAEGFNNFAGQLEATTEDMKQLAKKLISVREEERHHLARELHDEFGQYLTSISAEAACINNLAEHEFPSILPSSRAISNITVHMMESLQGILHQLRPVALEKFGLEASIEQLVTSWRRTHPATIYELKMMGVMDNLPEDVSIGIYRIIQESLTNAVRHANPARVSVFLARSETMVNLSIRDDGLGYPREREGKGGFGLLGMRERVLALGGQFKHQSCLPQGTLIEASLPVL